MLGDFALDQSDVCIGAAAKWIEADHILVETLIKLAVDVIDIGDSSRHAGSEVTAGFT